MKRAHYAGPLGALLLACTFMAIPAPSPAGAASKPAALKCTNSYGGAAGVIEKFTEVRATGVSCVKAHKVLFAYSSGPGPALGFTCTHRKTKAKDTYDVKCVDGSKKVTATDKVTY